MVATGRALAIFDEKVKEFRHDQQKEINSFRVNSQRPEFRREFDLNDPERLKKDIPARIGDEDPRCGVSSIQQFEGEDLSRPDRLKRQQEQMKFWTREVLQEQEAKRNAEKEAKRQVHYRAPNEINADPRCFPSDFSLEAEYLDEMNKKIQELKQQEDKLRHNRHMDVQSQNFQLADVKKTREEGERLAKLAEPSHLLATLPVAGLFETADHSRVANQIRFAQKSTHIS
jgi:hypothetical protein